MAPNSAMKVPVFPILLSPSSPKISPAGLGREGGRGGRGWEEGRRRGKQKGGNKELTQKRGANKRAIITSALEHLKHRRVKREKRGTSKSDGPFKAQRCFVSSYCVDVEAAPPRLFTGYSCKSATPTASATLWGIFGDFFFFSSWSVCEPWHFGLSVTASKTRGGGPCAACVRAGYCMSCPCSAVDCGYPPTTYHATQREKYTDINPLWGSYLQT